MEPTTIEEFIHRYYKPERLNAESGRAERIIADREHDVERFGKAIISKHDSVMGYAVSFEPNGTRP